VDAAVTRKGSTLATVAVALAAGVYITARAFRVPLTYDEASSFYRYIDADFAALFDFATATNHFLNTVLTRLSVGVLGASPIALRLPNVLAGALYLGVAAAFAWRMRDSAIAFAAAVLLMTNPYVLDYFAVSRGYGLAVALLLAAMLTLLRQAFAASLILAATAVIANFAVLPAFLAIVAIVGVQLLAQSPPHYAPRTDGRRFPWRATVAWLLLTGAFSWMVFSRERVLSAIEFVPMVVRVTGLYEEELAAIHVFRVDSTGRLREIRRQPGGVWQSGPVQDEWSLHVTLPASADRNLASLDVAVGDQVFRRDRREGGPWTVEDFEGERVLRSTGELRWEGNAAHTRFVAVHTAATVAVVFAFAVAMVALSKIPPVARRVEPAYARLIVSVLTAVAGLITAPLYLMRRDGQLFFGGTDGLAVDTVGSLIAGTAYSAPPPAWLPSAAAVVALIVLALPVIGRFKEAAIVSAVIGLVLLQAALQHALLDVPFPIGRTAVYLLPLFVLVVSLNADAIAASGERARKAATITMLILAGVSSLNAARVANLTYTADWRHDASTPAMLDRVARDSTPPPAVVRIGVEWMFYPVARYYAEQMSTPASRYDVLVLPGDGRPFDFIYAPDGVNLGRVTVVERFPLSGATLVRRGP
jgi:hypothetical protein